MALQEASSSKRKRLDGECEIDSATKKTFQKSKFVLSVTKKQYLDEKTADIYFLCGSERIPAHKSFLVRGSDTFYVKFFGEKHIVEGEKSHDKNRTENEIKLRKTSPEALKEWLQFFYFDEVQLKMENIVEVMGLANEFLMNECLEVCGDFWAKYLTIDDLCCAYYWAITHNVAGLKTVCERKICAYPENVFKTEGFLTSEFTVLENILELDLSCFEISILEACLEWGRYACDKCELDGSNIENLRICLKDSLYKIRFASIKLSEFTPIIKKYPNLYPNTEDYECIMCLLSRDFSKPGRFNPNQRSNHFKWDNTQNLTLILNRTNQNKWSNSTFTLTSHSFILSSNKFILFGGFYCTPILRRNASYTFSNSPETVNVEVYITDDKNKSKQLSPSILHISPNSEPFLDLRCKPVVINPAHKYCIELKIYSNNLYCSPYNINSEVKLNEKITIRTHANEEGQKIYTCVEKLIFNPL